MKQCDEEWSMEERYGYVYKITNLVNNKIYVGKRVAKEFDQYYWGSGKIIIQAIRKYGKDQFTRDVIEWCYSKEQLCERERFWIKELNARDLSVGYNIQEGGEGGRSYVGENPMKGKKLNLSEESRAKMVAAHKGIAHTEDTKRKMSLSQQAYWDNNPQERVRRSLKLSINNPWKGKHHKPETIALIKEKNRNKVPWNKGKVNCYTEETRYAMGASMRGKDTWNKGKIGCYSDETLQQMRDSHLGKKQSQETINKRVEKLKGIPRPPEVRQKISEGNKGRVWTDEEKLKHKEIMKSVQYTITCRRCGNQFVSHSSASKYCDDCKKR